MKNCGREVLSELGEQIIIVVAWTKVGVGLTKVGVGLTKVGVAWRYENLIL